MAAIDADLRIEYFKGGSYANLYGVPAARLNALRKPELDWSGLEGYPRLGFVIRLEGLTLYHTGLGPYYTGLGERLRRYQATVMLCAVGAGGFTPAEAASLAEECGIAWVAPMPGTPAEPGWADGFLDHMLGHRPAQRFKIFEFGERWNPDA
ncbi:MAG: hypothetical protein FJW40_04530 [Acidobacteria bacterium]|nr:hypothetical protein [Acidobacteriota bacterium]